MLAIWVLVLGLMAWTAQLCEAVPMGTVLSYYGRPIDVNGYVIISYGDKVMTRIHLDNRADW